MEQAEIACDSTLRRNTYFEGKKKRLEKQLLYGISIMKTSDNR